MPQFGSGRSITAQNQSAVADSNGNLIVSPDDSFGGSPLGIAARTQALYGIPNANFDILPADPYSPVNSGNPLPYWDTQISGEGTATMQYDTTTQSWALRLDPTAGTASGETITLKTRTFLLNDSNLTLRQKAFASITKVGTQATSEWDLVLSATYYSEAGVQLSTYNIGTANSGATWTTINGFTTSGTAAIDPAAHYADIALTLTTSGSVAGTAMVDINSLLIQTSTGGGGAQSFVLTQTFNSSGTFTVPTGVEYVTVVAIGAGQGGSGASYRVSSATPQANAGAAGGATGYYALVRDIYVGDVGTAGISVGIGAGGTGGTATTISKAAGSATPTEFRRDTVSAGGDGGNTTFGTYLTVPGARTAPSGFLGILTAAGASAGTAGGAAGGNGGVGGTHTIGSTNTGAPYLSLLSTATAGSAGIGSGGTGASGTAGAAATGTAIAGGGGGGGGGTVSITGLVATAGAGASGGPGGSGGGGGAVARYSASSATMTGTAGNGGDAIANTGGGGGGGGALVISISSGAAWTGSSITARASSGGAGGSGLLKVIYVG